MRASTFGVLIAWVLTLAAASPRAFATTPPLKVASLVPFVSEALLTAPTAGVLLVATVRSSAGWKPPASVTDLGNAHAPDLERLAAVGATVLVADRRWHARMGDQAAALGLRVLWVQAESVEGTLSEIERVGRELGAGAELARATARVRERLAVLRIEGVRRVLLVFGAPGSFLVGTERTWLGDLVSRIGGELVAPELGAARELGYPGYLPLSDELLATVAVDAVMLVAHGDPSAVGDAFGREWERLRGGAASPVVALDPQDFAVNPGLRLAEAGGTLVTALDAVGREPQAR